MQNSRNSYFHRRNIKSFGPISKEELDACKKFQYNNRLSVLISAGVEELTEILPKSDNHFLKSSGSCFITLRVMEAMTESRSQNWRTLLNPFMVSLIAGSGSGTAVDCILFPLDTIKTRLQNSAGFWSSGGFSGIYRGIGPAFVGSAPTAAIFFATYDTTKRLLAKVTGKQNDARVHMMAAICGEVSACLVRVPVEIIKQRRQVTGTKEVRGLIADILKREGPQGFYRGYFGTIMREIPFSIIQFPLWEFLKHRLTLKRNQPITPFQSSICGAIAGGIAAALTTPLDVVKTRIMLADFGAVESSGKILVVMKRVYVQNGLRGLYAGVVPRTLLISLGGFIFFGTYELIKETLTDDH